MFFFKYLHVAHMFPGTIGHVAHGKSTLVKAISGVQVIDHSVSHLSIMW